MIIKILAILFSLSARNPMIDTAPFDYEARIGIRGSNYNVICLYERENGIYGYGDDISYIRKFKTLHTSHIKFTSYVRETKEMNTKTVDIYNKYENIEYGVSLALSGLEKLDFMGYVGYKTRHITADLRMNFDRIISNLLLEYRIPIQKHISLHPFLKYHKNNDKTDWQAKVEIEYLL